MQTNKGRREERNEKKKDTVEENQEKNKEKIKESNKDPLKFFVQMGDCTPQIYQLVIAFNPEVAYDKLKFNEKFLRALVEETNAALVPVLQKHIDILKKLQG